MFNAKIGSWKDPCHPIVSSNHVEVRGTFIEACMDRLTCCILHINIVFLLAVDIRGTGYVNSQYFYQCETMEWLVPRRSPWPISRGNVCLPLFARRHMGRRYKWRGCLRKQKKPLQRKAWWFLHGLLVLLITGQMSKRLSFSEMVCAKSGKRIRWLDLNVSSLRSKPNYWEILKLVILQEIWGWFWSVTLGSVYPRRIQRLYTSL